MGTNYYWFKNSCKPEVLPESGLHIGKCSAGWVFHFQAHQSLELGTVDEYREFTKTGYIYDEYGNPLSYKEFWDMVEYTKEPFNGINPYCRYETIIPGIEDWTNDGYMFTLGDFS